MLFDLARRRRFEIEKEVPFYFALPGTVPAALYIEVRLCKFCVIEFGNNPRVQIQLHFIGNATALGLGQLYRLVSTPFNKYHSSRFEICMRKYLSPKKLRPGHRTYLGSMKATRLLSLISGIFDDQ